MPVAISVMKPMLHDVVVAAGLERGAGGRAQGGGVEVVVTQAAAGEAVERGRGDRAAEGAGGAEAEVVDEDDDHIRRAGRGGWARRAAAA